MFHLIFEDIDQNILQYTRNKQYGVIIFSIFYYQHFDCCEHFKFKQTKILQSDTCMSFVSSCMKIWGNHVSWMGHSGSLRFRSQVDQFKCVAMYKCGILSNSSKGISSSLCLDPSHYYLHLYILMYFFTPYWSHLYFLSWFTSHPLSLILYTDLLAWGCRPLSSMRVTIETVLHTNIRLLCLTNNVIPHITADVMQ